MIIGATDSGDASGSSGTGVPFTLTHEVGDAPVGDWPGENNTGPDWESLSSPTIGLPSLTSGTIGSPNVYSNFRRTGSYSNWVINASNIILEDFYIENLRIIINGNNVKLRQGKLISPAGLGDSTDGIGSQVINYGLTGLVLEDLVLHCPQTSVIACPVSAVRRCEMYGGWNYFVISGSQNAICEDNWLHSMNMNPINAHSDFIQSFNTNGVIYRHNNFDGEFVTGQGMNSTAALTPDNYNYLFENNRIRGMDRGVHINGTTNGFVRFKGNHFVAGSFGSQGPVLWQSNRNLVEWGTEDGLSEDNYLEDADGGNQVAFPKPA